MSRTPVRLARIGGLALLIVVTLACATPTTSGAPLASSAPSPATSAAADATSSAAPDTSNAITIKGFKFTPASLTVPKGTTVTWTNEEDSLHTVSAGTPDAPSGLFDSGEIDTGVEFPFTFDRPGTYPFFCSRHDFMRGEVTVTP